jgi:hypothetical protein
MMLDFHAILHRLSWSLLGRSVWKTVMYILLLLTTYSVLLVSLHRETFVRCLFDGLSTLFRCWNYG